MGGGRSLYFQDDIRVPHDDSLAMEALVARKRSRQPAGNGIAWGAHLSRLEMGPDPCILAGAEGSSDGLKGVIDAF